MVKNSKEIEDKKADLVAAGDEIRRARKAALLTQTAAAKLLHVSAQSVQHWERGDNAPGRNRWNAISSLYSIDAAALYNGTTALQSIKEKMIPAKAVMRLAESIQADVTALKILASDTVSNKIVRGAGFKPIKPARKKAVSA